MEIIVFIIAAIAAGYFLLKKNSNNDNKKPTRSEGLEPDEASTLKPGKKLENVQKAPKIFYSHDYGFRHPFSDDDKYFNHFIERYRDRLLFLTEDKSYSDWVIDSHMNDPKITSGNGVLRSSIIHSLDNALATKLADKIIDSHMPALMRKYKQLTYKDDYGVIEKDKWEKEAKTFTKRVLLPNISDDIMADPLCKYSSDCLISEEPEALEYWMNYITISVEAEIDNDTHGILTPHDSEHIVKNDAGEMSGIEYEEYVAEIIDSLGWKVTQTPATGDHGADIIADNGQSRIVVQCKKYSSPVGNKSVQEAFSAKSFYDCTDSIVVTNNSFTPAARQAASKLNVSLLHHEQLQEFLESK